MSSHVINALFIEIAPNNTTPRGHTMNMNTNTTTKKLIIRLAASKLKITQLAADGADTGDGKFAAIKEAAKKIEQALAELDAARTDAVAAAAVTDACKALEAAISALYDVKLRTFTTMIGRVTLTAGQLRECVRTGVDPAAWAEAQARRHWVR